MLEQASQLELPARRGAELRVELGGLYADKLDEHERAIECFEDAIKLDADNAGAARPLVGASTSAQKRYKDAEPLVRDAGAQLGRARSGREASLLVHRTARSPRTSTTTTRR